MGLRSAVFGENRVANTCSVRRWLLVPCHDAASTIGWWGSYPRRENEAPASQEVGTDPHQHNGFTLEMRESSMSFVRPPVTHSRTYEGVVILALIAPSPCQSHSQSRYGECIVLCGGASTLSFHFLCALPSELVGTIWMVLGCPSAGALRNLGPRTLSSIRRATPALVHP